MYSKYQYCFFPPLWFTKKSTLENDWNLKKKKTFLKLEYHQHVLLKKIVYIASLIGSPTTKPILLTFSRYS